MLKFHFHFYYGTTIFCIFSSPKSHFLTQISAKKNFFVRIFYKFTPLRTNLNDVSEANKEICD